MLGRRARRRSSRARGGVPKLRGTKRGKGELAFLGVFAVYTAIAVFLLLLGIGAALAVDEGTRKTFETWAAAGGAFGPIWLTVARAAQFNEPVPQMVLDYLISALNIGCALLIVWKRPNDWVARLLGLALVGTSMAYNLQSHGVAGIAGGAAARGGVPAARYLNFIHWGFHAVAGLAYVHAFLIFPNGRLVPRRALWLLVVLYSVMAEELLYPIYNLVTGTQQNPSLIVFIFQETMNARPLQNFDGVIQSEVVFFVLLFGLLTPIVGIWSQLYRYRRTSSAIERQQTRVVVWALTAAFSAALVIIALGVIGLAASGTVFSAGSSALLEQILLRVTPPIYAVLPVAILVAVFRYRLFDIELVIDRTMIYAPLTAVLALVFLASLFVLQQFLKAVIGQPSELAIAVAAFVNAILFQPMRRRVQAFIDTRFFARAPARAKPAEVTAT